MFTLVITMQAGDGAFTGFTINGFTSSNLANQARDKLFRSYTDNKHIEWFSIDMVQVQPKIIQ